MIVASCGHYVEHISHLWDCTIKSFSREGARAIEYTSLCKECYDLHDSEGLVLQDEDAENTWLETKHD